MIKDTILIKAEQLLEEKRYTECIDVISEYINNGNNSNYVYVLKCKALYGLGQINDIRNILINRINWVEPLEEDIEMIRLVEQSVRLNFWNIEGDRLLYIYNIITKNYKDSIIYDVTNKVNSAMIKIGNNNSEYLVYNELAWLNFIKSNNVKAAIYYYAYKMSSSCDDVDLSSCLAATKNVSDIFMYLSEKNDIIGVVIEDVKDINDYLNIAKTLAYIGKKVVVVCPAVEEEIDGTDYNIEYYISLSFKNMEIKEGIKYYVPLILIKNNHVIENTLFYLLAEIANQIPNRHLPFIAERKTLDNLYSEHVSRKELHYICNGFEYKNSKECTCFAYVRGYQEYISKIYKVNVIKQLMSKSKYAFSVIIPVRNNARTLRYTLKTCLEQSFCDYEIVVSDNSDPANMSINNLVNELSSDKIKYYRTPRNLPISKSFEFAYIKSQGEFMVPIGADDAVLFNGLSSLNAVLNEFPRENIILWDRLHYVWPNFIISSQVDQFIIPTTYEKSNIKLSKIGCMQMLREVISFKRSMYSLPLLYINSGMKRRYLMEILDKTGSIIDGVSQDIYTGITNLAINKEILYLRHPITIAALSSHSSGVVSISGNENQADIKNRIEEYLNTNIGNHVERNIESLIPILDGDISNLISSVLRLVDKQCIDYEVIKLFDWKQIFRKITEQLQKNDINLEPLLKRIANSARNISPELYNWFNSELNLHNFNFLEKRPGESKNYFKGIGPGGSLNLDASDFGIKNVYEASQFFHKLYDI